MMSLLLKSAAMFALLVSAPSVPDTTSDASPVPLVLCTNSAGSAFRIGLTLILSVSHVVSASGCEIGNKPIHVIYNNGSEDFAILQDVGPGKFLKVDCGGFVQGHLYVAIGHIRASDTLTGVPMVGTGKTQDGLSILAGVMEVQPGMSGGPIIDAQTNEVVGTVNAAEWEDGLTFSRELKGTSICAGKA